jgi:subtilase family serine protease
LAGNWDFAARFGPPSALLAQLDSFMRGAGLHAVAGPSSFLARYMGTTRQVAAAFHTQIADFRLPDGGMGYANTTPLQIPAALAGTISGVIGLDSVTQARPFIMRPARGRAQPQFGAAPGYFGGLTPSQIRGIYSADPIYEHVNGGGRTSGVFELSGWSFSDVRAYEIRFGLHDTFLQQVNVDGGPTHHFAAGEVALDIDMQLALAAGVSRIYVYDAPDTVQGLVDEMAAIARQNLVDALSISWGVCEADRTAATMQAELTALEQMASQGESAFAAAGDYGAYGCEYRDAQPGPYLSFTNTLQVDDPASDPYITAVGGTSFFGTYDPGHLTTPAYPGGKEYVWNTLNNCMNRPFYYQGQNLGYCPYGAGGGGNSRVWARPSYQRNSGVSSRYSAVAPWCKARSGTPCREVPDVAIDADPNTGYGIYCADTGDPLCASSPGWNEVGGTSAGAPLWAAIAVLADDYHHRRQGLLNMHLYVYDTTSGYRYDMHDIAHAATFTYAGVRYTVGTNGYFPVTPDYDMATGIGTPIIYAFAESW